MRRPNSSHWIEFADYDPQSGRTANIGPHRRQTPLPADSRSPNLLSAFEICQRSPVGGTGEPRLVSDLLRPTSPMHHHNPISSSIAKILDPTIPKIPVASRASSDFSVHQRHPAQPKQPRDHSFTATATSTRPVVAPKLLTAGP